jgi:hypothetical protein
LNAHKCIEETISGDDVAGGARVLKDSAVGGPLIVQYRQFPKNVPRSGMGLFPRRLYLSQLATTSKTLGTVQPLPFQFLL